MNKISNTLIGLLFAPALFLTMASDVRAEDCNGDICATITSAGGHGSLATASITNKGIASARVSFPLTSFLSNPDKPAGLILKFCMIQKRLPCRPDKPSKCQSIPQNV